VNLRRPTWDDLPAVLDVARAADIAVVGESDWTESDLREEWSELDLAHDAWIAEVDGRVGGFASFENRRGRLQADGYVHPELRGRGIGSAILDVTEERAREEAVPGDGPARLQNATLNADDATVRFYEARGYRRVRHFWRMVVDLESAPVATVPAGIDLRPYRHQDDGPAVHATLEEAFLDHWENRPRPYEDWAKRQFGGEHFDPTLWWVAMDGDEPAGAIVCEWKRHGDWGWVGILGVRRRWRRRGIAEALLHTAFAEFFRRGERRVALAVDAQNPTGATRLYERSGMRVLWEAVVWEKALA
jgi:mycothiol synthase